MDIKFIATNKWDNMFGSQLRTQGGTLVDTSDVLEKAVDGIMIYYGAGYLDACRKFNPLFIKRYKELVKAGKKMWVVYVSDDSTESRFDDTVKDMPWLSVPFKNKKQIVALRDRFKVSKYPTVMVLGQGGNVFTNQGVGLVLSGMAIDLTREPPKDLGQWQMEAELTKVYKGTRGGHVFCISGCGDQEHRNALAEAASQKLNNVNCGPLTYAFTQVVEEATREHKTYSYIEFCKRLQRHLSHGIHKRDTKTKEERNNPIQSFLGATPKTKVSNNPYGGLNAQGESSGIGDVHDVRPGMAENPMISSNVMFDLKDKFAI